VTDAPFICDGTWEYHCCKRPGKKLDLASQQKDRSWMQETLRICPEKNGVDEIPIQALIHHPDLGVVAKTSNQCIHHHDPTAHAEILAIRKAGITLSNYRLNGCTLYVSLEPCPMCFYALMQARIHRIVFAAPDTSLGILSKGVFEHTHAKLNHHFSWTGGVCSDLASSELRTFFANRR